jgi:hypothetical protein
MIEAIKGVIMRSVMIFTIFIFALILTGCETDHLKNENKNLISRLNEANKQIQDLHNTKKSLEETTSIQKQQENELNWYKSAITDVMNIKDFQYEIISQAIDKEPHDKVVYIKNVSEVNKDQTLYLLKAAIVFSGDVAKTVTFWRDRNKAILYRDGKYDSNEGPLGWSGFDYRFGSIINDGQHSKLRQYNSRDDSQYIDFGKYTSLD